MDKPLTPMSKENLSSHIAGFPIIKSPLSTVWITKPSKKIRQESSKMKNILRDFAEWTLVVIAFGLVAASLYYMGVFDWLSI